MNIGSSIAAFVAGILVGATGLYFTLGTQAAPPVVAAAPALAIPSEAEASAAFAAIKKSFPKSTVKLGQCDKDTMGPGVRCTVEWQRNFPGSQPIMATAGFSRGPGGEWVAVHYF